MPCVARIVKAGELRVKVEYQKFSGTRPRDRGRIRKVEWNCV